MKPETLLKAMTDIDDDYIVEAQKKSFRLFTPYNLKMALSLATVCLIIIGSVIILPKTLGRKSASGMDAVNAPVNMINDSDKVTFNIQGKNFRTEEVEEDGVTVTAVLNDDNEIEYTVRKVDENTLEVFNLPAMNYEDTREIGGTVYKLMGNDDMVKYILWNRNGYNYLVSIVNSCTVDEALRIVINIE